MTSTGHSPVMLHEVVEVLRPRADGIYVDGTFGSGGYARALLDAAPCRVWGIDRDPEAVRRGDAMAREFAGRLTVLHGRFGDMAELLRARRVIEVDGVALDLGVSSMQLDEAARGFSFREDGPLDMRMEQQGPTAADVVNTLDEGALADLIFAYGEERRARRVAKAIVNARAKKPIARTGELAEIVRRAVPPSKDGIDPATRTFQALRIHVNDELGQLDAGLAAAETLLRAGGRLAAVSFHSLEDRRVKEFLRTRSGAAPRASRHLPAEREGRQPTFALLERRPIRPSAAEIAANPRARSARLRAAERTAAPAWDAHPKGTA
jgi:16S rRNA (cytosine1402-N4)-methyltransferase